MKTIGIILAAGEGTRMRSSLPKVLHPLGGRAMIWHSLEAIQEASGEKPVLVIGHQADRVRTVIGSAADYVTQEPQLGTAHAVQQTQALVRGAADLVLVTNADMPLIPSSAYRRLIELQRAKRGAIAMMTAHAAEARGFGRVVRDAQGQVHAIVEQAHATPEQLAIQELNVGAFCFAAEWLWSALTRVPLSPKGEYYLTDLVKIASDEGSLVQTVSLDDPEDAIGINTRVHLAEAEAILRARINRAWMLSGVTLVDPDTTYIEAGVTIGTDTVIWPNTHLQGDTQVGSSCTLGPNTVIRASRLGDRCRVLAAVLERAVLEDDVDIGPFGHLRKGAHLAQGVHLGNFGEVKNAYLGPGTKMGHFSYIGDAEIGSNVNIGAGTITCNYDGERKHKTEIEKDAFIGSDTMLVAPVKLGEGSQTGAGAVVTHDVPPHTLVAGVPAQILRKLKHSD